VDGLVGFGDVPPLERHGARDGERHAEDHQAGAYGLRQRRWDERQRVASPQPVPQGDGGEVHERRR